MGVRAERKVVAEETGGHQVAKPIGVCNNGSRGVATATNNLFITNGYLIICTTVSGVVFCKPIIG